MYLFFNNTLVYKILKMTKFCHFMTYTYHLNLPRLQNQFLYTQKTTPHTLLNVIQLVQRAPEYNYTFNLKN